MGARRRRSQASLAFVTFEIFPAIDVAGGRLVSVSSGGVRPVDAFGGSPLAAAEAFVSMGAVWIHVVDVNRANGGEQDIDLVRAIAALGAGVQASGGIETGPAARATLDAGATRVVLGSPMLARRNELAELVTSLGDAAVVGIEAAGPVIRPRSVGPELPLSHTLEWLSASGAERYLYTGVARVGRLGGPDTEGIRAAARTLAGPVLAAGGIRGIEDVLALRELGPDVVDGAVVGRALYEGLELRDVLSALG